MSERERVRLSKELSRNLGKLFESFTTEGPVVGGFAPVGEEPLWDLGTRALRMAFPVCRGGGGMIFRESHRGELVGQVVSGREIPSPTEEKKAVKPDILLAPGLAFSPRGDRLGRGQGFYDRYLGNFSGLKIGLCWQCQIFNDIPHEKHDQTVDFVVTEESVYQGGEFIIRRRP